jgi:hypothetical protein
MKRLASADPPQTTAGTGDGPIFLDGQDEVFAARRMKATLASEDGTQTNLIDANGANCTPGGQIPETAQQSAKIKFRCGWHDRGATFSLICLRNAPVQHGFPGFPGVIPAAEQRESRSGQSSEAIPVALVETLLAAGASSDSARRHCHASERRSARRGKLPGCSAPRTMKEFCGALRNAGRKPAGIRQCCEAGDFSSNADGVWVRSRISLRRC